MFLLFKEKFKILSEETSTVEFKIEKIRDHNDYHC